MALSADKLTEYTEGVDISIPVDDGDKIYEGAMVCVNASGYAVVGADASGLIFMGIAREQADNTSGSDGAINVTVRRRGLFNMTFHTAISIANVGDNVFIYDDGTVDLTGNVTYNIFVGVIAKYIDTTHAWVDIEPAIKQADVATHIADTSGAHAASAISITDAGNHFAAAEATVEAATQKLAKGPFFLTLPRFTGWTKDGTDKTITALPAVESPNPVIVKRAYVNLGTAPGADKTLVLKLNNSTIATITGTDTQGEDESLAIEIAANTDFIIKANETSSGSAANCDIVLVMYVDDGE